MGRPHLRTDFYVLFSNMDTGDFIKFHIIMLSSIWIGFLLRNYVIKSGSGDGLDEILPYERTLKVGFHGVSIGITVSLFVYAIIVPLFYMHFKYLFNNEIWDPFTLKLYANFMYIIILSFSVGLSYFVDQAYTFE